MNVNNCAGARAGIELKLVWVSSYVGLIGKELVDVPTQQVALEGYIFDRTLSPSDFRSLASSSLMRAWQAK
jgi:hypothetical protein